MLYRRLLGLLLDIPNNEAAGSRIPSFEAQVSAGLHQPWLQPRCVHSGGSCSASLEWRYCPKWQWPDNIFEIEILTPGEISNIVYRWGISGAEMISASRRGSVADSAVRRTREMPPAAAVPWLIPPSAANAKCRQPPWICGWFRRPPHTRNSASRRARMVGKDGLS